MDEQTKEKILSLIAKYLISFFKKGSDKEISIEIPIGNPPESIPNAESVDQKELDQSSTPKFTLIHKRFCADGIFGELQRDGAFVAYTLEHSYDNKPKVADGTYTCVRGPHRLNGMIEDFITFEIKDIPNFNGVPVTGILFHWGNYNLDSSGCVLLGSTETPTMIGNSKLSWEAFMKMLDGIDNFKLTVISEA